MTCAHCYTEFVVYGKGSRFNGQGKCLCDECYTTVKHCKKCDTFKSRSEFNASPGKANGLAGHCRECMKAKWLSLPKSERFKRQQGSRFGITHDDYLQMLNNQSGVCAICQQPPSELNPDSTLKLLHIDHCHITGQVRALLCGNCNKALGCMVDDPERLRAAADYLEHWKAISVVTAR